MTLCKRFTRAYEYHIRRTRMNQQQLTQRDTAYSEAIVERLREHYLAHTPLPGDEGKLLTIPLFYRLARYVMAEGYGYQDLRRNSARTDAQPIEGSR
jgi:hypothetical protein